MELYYKEERDRDLFRAYNEALKSLGKMAVELCPGADCQACGLFHSSSFLYQL